MNRQETLALYNQGREVWNRWAKEQLERRDDSAAWADFTGHEFNIPDQATRTADQQCRLQRSTMPIEVQVLLEPYRREGQNSGVLGDNANFPPFIDFIGFIFPGDALFSNAQFPCGASFGHTEFRGSAVFDGTLFSGPLVFSATLHESLTFNNAKFIGQACFPGLCLVDDNNPLPDRAFTFNSTVFKQNVSFSGSVFPTSRVMFRQAVFEHEADFMNASFNGPALFDWATFKSRAMFHRTTCRSSIQFNDVSFEGDTNFDEATFHKKAYFHAIRVSSFFRMAGAEFLKVPDFDQATFTQAPPLHNVKISPQHAPNRFTAPFKTYFNGSPEDEQCWRALRRLAVQSHDHFSEQRFFRQELLARRGTTERVWHASFWLGLFYQIFSDFGRSLSRPLVWWISGILFFSVVYVACHPATDRWFPSTCVKGTGNPPIAALGLSLHNSLPALSGLRDKLPEFYACLYGANSQNSSGPVLPDVVSLLGVLQVLFSATMIFLFLLAVRNHFKIK